MSKAIRIHATGGIEQLRYEDVEVGAPGAGQVLIRNHAVGLNFIDIYFRTGLYPTPALPATLGFEGAGVIEAVGEGVTHLKVGDRVGYCQGPLGAYAQYKLQPAWQVLKLPKFLSFEEAAASMLKGLTVQYLFRQTYRLQGGETILFHAAAGGVGLIACQWAKALKVKLIGTASTDAKCDLAKSHGAWQTINYSRENVVERVLALTKNAKCPVVYDGVGKDTWPASLDCTQPRGLVVTFGNASGPVDGVNLGILSAKGSLYVTRPTLGTYVSTQEKLQVAADEFFDLIKRKKIKIDIDLTLPLSEAATAHERMGGRQTTGSTVLIP